MYYRILFQIGRMQSYREPKPIKEWAYSRLLSHIPIEEPKKRFKRWESKRASSKSGMEALFHNPEYRRARSADRSKHLG